MFKKLFKFNQKKDNQEEKVNDEIQDSQKIDENIDSSNQDNKNKEEKLNNIDANDLVEETEGVITEEKEDKTENSQENLTKEVSDLEKEEKNIEEDIKEENKEDNKQNNIEETREEAISEVIEEELVNETSIEEEISIEEVEEKKVGLFDKLKQGLTKAKQGITDKIDDVLKSYTKVDEELLEELEEILITADVGVNTTMNIIDELRDKIKQKGITNPLDVREELKSIVEDILAGENSSLNVDCSPTIILMVGVNGVGKTTTIGKLAYRYKKEGKKVLLAAGDTFRAAAAEQLDIWAKRSNVDIIKHQEGADPGAVIFDAIKAAKARKTDILICDTAGRLHNKANLMNELGKVFKIVDREFPEAKKEVLLVVDATTGQNAVVQAKTFKEVANITGIVLTKLDGTAKGGVVLAVKSEVDVPVKLIGVGEKVEDLQEFDSKLFSDALFGN